MKRDKLPKEYLIDYCPLSNNKQQSDYYNILDFVTGNVIRIFERSYFIYDCDEFTKSFY